MSAAAAEEVASAAGGPTRSWAGHVQDLEPGLPLHYIFRGLACLPVFVHFCDQTPAAAACSWGGDRLFDACVAAGVGVVFGRLLLRPSGGTCQVAARASIAAAVAAAAPAAYGPPSRRQDQVV